jgi:hypothetical protein
MYIIYYGNKFNKYNVVISISKLKNKMRSLKMKWW